MPLSTPNPTMTEAAPGWWPQALAEFGAQLGFPESDTRWTGDVVNLALAGGRYLVDVERAGDEVVLAVLRTAPAADVEAKARLLLRGACFDRDHPFPVQVGLKGADVFVVAARVVRAEYHRLYEAFALVRRLYADVGL